jgi:UDP-GlcNAc3NAcA epimerase
MRIVTVVGARPQFIKAAAVSRVIRDSYAHKICEVIVHTGQHHDENMSKVFFDQLDIPRPDFNLEIAGGPHGQMTGRMLEAIEQVILAQKPDWVVVYGDTNSTLAGALAAAKLRIPVAHVEAGLRSFNMQMPEEINRILTDRVSTLLFCPTETAVRNLRNEGTEKGVHQVGDVMFDVALFYGDRARSQSTILKTLNLNDKSFVLATCHRAENTDNARNLEQILSALSGINSQHLPVILPLHPRTRKKVEDFGLDRLINGLVMTEPLPYLDMIALEQAAKVILTDSGGVQKEAFFHGVPCVTMREETEWTETVELDSNRLAGANRTQILEAFTSLTGSTMPRRKGTPYGSGDAAHRLVEQLIACQMRKN